MEGLGLGLRPWPGLKLEPRLEAAAGLGVEEEQQTTGQGWLEHRSKVGMTRPGAELLRPVVTEEARGWLSEQQAAGPRSPAAPARGHLSPLPTLQTPPQARTQQQRGLCARQPRGHRGLSELSGPKALAGPAGGEGWAELRGEPEQGGLGVPEEQEGQEEVDRDGGKEAGRRMAGARGRRAGA